MSKNKDVNLNKQALKGFLFSLPFIVANFIAVREFEPFYSLLHSFTSVHPAPVLPLVLLLLFPWGAYVSMKPVFGNKTLMRKGAFLNWAVAILLLSVFAVLAFAFLEEFYRCDILRIPNCD